MDERMSSSQDFTTNKLEEKLGFVIPAIDLLEGKCVRLTQGNFDQKKVYYEDPLQVALQFEEAGLRRLHLVDLDGAKQGKVKNWKALEVISAKTKLIVDFGGGVCTTEEVDRVFSSGGTFCTIGSLAVRDENLFLSWLNHFGTDRFLLGADVKSERILIRGWQESTGLLVYDFVAKYARLGVRRFFCTDVSMDGMLAGPSFPLYAEMLKRQPELYLIASGGVSTTKDLKQLKSIGCSAAIVGKAIYEGRLTLADLARL